MSAPVPTASSTKLDAADSKRLEELFTHLKDMAPYNVGYPCTQIFD